MRLLCFEELISSRDLLQKWPQYLTAQLAYWLLNDNI